MPNATSKHAPDNGPRTNEDAMRGDAFSGGTGLNSSNLEKPFSGTLPVGSNATLNAVSPVVISGGAASKFSGYQVSPTGDVNADGIDDFLIGDIYIQGSTAPGPVNVVFGRAGNWPAGFDLDTLDGTNGFRITSPPGFNVGNAGDVNGDGISDILTRDAVIFGSDAPFDATMDVSDLDGRNGFRVIDFNTIRGDSYTVAGLGDVNDDGVDDVAFAVLGGTAHIVFGSDIGFAKTVSVAALDGNSGFTVTGFDNGRHVPTVAAAGDLNGDGIDDFLVSAQDFNRSFVIFGLSGGFDARIDVRDLDGKTGFRIDGAAGSLAGLAMAGIGDINGDGLDDLAIGAPWARPSGHYKQGQAYVLYGSDEGFASAVNLEALDGPDGFRIPGLYRNDHAGATVSGSGDMNGDGIADFTVGTHNESYIIYGKTDDFNAVLDLSTLDGNRGRTIAVNDAYYAGRDIQVAGDVNNDGIDDVLIPIHTLERTLLYFGETGGDHPGSDFAQDDEITVSSDMLDASGWQWFRLGALNNNTDLLENDTSAQEIVSVNGAAIVPGLWFDGDGGGRFRVHPGGVVDFRNLGTKVADGDTTGFTYTATDGTALDTARVSVTVDATVDIAQDDSFEVTDHALAAAGRSWFRLGALNDHTDLLENDPGVDELIFVDGLPLEEGVWFEGSNGGQFRTFPGGVVDFRNRGDTVAVGDTTGFSYGVMQDGVMDTAVVSLTVRQFSERGPNAPLLIKGINAGDSSGWSVSSAGDVDGDGLDDVIIGAYRADPDGVSDAGESYLVFGSALAAEEFGSGTLDLSALGSNIAVVINGVDMGDRSGDPVSSAGDVDGDGLDDVIIGAWLADPDGLRGAGESYLVFGATLAAQKAGDGVLDLSALDSDTGVVIRGIDIDDFSGASVSSAGDVDGDGLQDVIIGATWADPDGVYRAGESYLVYGSALAAEKTGDGILDLSALDVDTGVLIKGVDAQDNSGVSVSTAGDVDGDGLDDVIIGAHRADPDGVTEAGESYLVFGSALAAVKSEDGILNLNGLDKHAGILIKGIDRQDRSGTAVSTAGDVDGDGRDDVIIGAWLADPDGIAVAGESYLIFGAALTAEKTGDGTVDLADLNSEKGVVIKGIGAEDHSGWSVSSAGDVDGDGLDDVIIGAPFADPDGLNRAGESYLIFGAALAAEKTGDGILDLDGLRADTGILIRGVDDGDVSGWSVSSAGDVHGDGLDDVIVGARGADPDGRTSAGETYVLSGALLTEEKTDDGIIDLSDWFF